MAAPYSNLETKVEVAGKAVYDNNSTGYNAFTGLDSATKTASGIMFHGEKGSENPLNSGNYDLKLTITIMDASDRVTLADHRTGAAGVEDIFLDDDIAATLSGAVEDFTVLMVKGRNGTSTRTEDRQFISEISLDLYACAKDITA